MPTSDVLLTFDKNPFVNGMKSVTKSMDAMKKGAMNMARNVSKGIMNAAGKIGLLIAGFKAAKGLLNQMPEIGQAFGLAKDVILKNMLFPIRKALFPMLQRMLDWVRDHRGMFIKWGQTLVNVFTAVGAMLKPMVRLAKDFAKILLEITNKILGQNIRSFQELIDVLSFKFVALVQFLGMLGQNIFGIFKDMEPTFLAIWENVKGIASKIGELVKNLFSANEDGNSFLTVFKTIAETAGIIFEKVTGFVNSFLEGFVPAVKEVATPLQNIANTVKRIFENLFGGERGEKLKSFFKQVGEVFGKTIVTAFETIEKVVKVIEPIIYTLFDMITKVVEFFSGQNTMGGKVEAGVTKEFQKFIEGMTPKQAEDALGSGKIGKFDIAPGSPVWKLLEQRAQSVNDALITKDGQVIEFDPMDNIMAFKGAPPKAGGNITVELGGVHVSVTEGDAERAGMNFASGLANKLRDELIAEGERLGL